MRPSEITIEWLLERLQDVEGGNGSWVAWCPCHDDVGSEHKGLSISVVGNRILCKCQSPHCGATLPRVIEALEGQNGQVDEHVVVRSHKASKSENGKGSGMQWWVERTHVEQDVWEELGCVSYENGVAFLFAGLEVKKIRKPPKEMAWIGKGEAPPIWPVPGDELPEHITLTEGESDCGTAVVADLPCPFAVTKGAGAELSPELFAELQRRGVRRLSLVGDSDKSGRSFIAQCEGLALECGLEVFVYHLWEVLDPFEGSNDLNGLYRQVEYDVGALRELLGRCVRASSRRSATTTVEEIGDVIREENWLIPGLLAPGDKVLLSGPQKSYKTWVGLDLARCLVSGTKFLSQPDWTPTEPCNILFVQEEGGEIRWMKRLQRLQLEGGARTMFKYQWRPGFRFTERDRVNEMIATCREHEIKVLFLDPLQRMIPGVDENSNSDTGIVWDEVMRIQQACPDIVVIVIHHANKAAALSWESVRGASRHAGEVDLGVFVQKHPIEDNVVRITIDGRDIPQYMGTGEAFEAKVHISLDRETPQFSIDASPVQVNVNQVQATAMKNKDGVLLAIGDGCTTVAAIVSQTGIGDNTVKKYLRRLVEEGEIREEDHGEGKARTYAPR